MKRTILAISVSLFLPLFFLTGCSEATMPTTAPGSDAQVSQPDQITGTWRKLDGSAFILINETQIAFYYPNASIEDFWNYEYDGKELDVFDEGGLLVTRQCVEMDGSLMTLKEVLGGGYDGAYQRTGGF